MRDTPPWPDDDPPPPADPWGAPPQRTGPPSRPRGSYPPGPPPEPGAAGPPPGYGPPSGYAPRDDGYGSPPNAGYGPRTGNSHPTDGRGYGPPHAPSNGYGPAPGYGAPNGGYDAPPVYHPPNSGYGPPDQRNYAPPPLRDPRYSQMPPDGGYGPASGYSGGAAYDQQYNPATQRPSRPTNSRPTGNGAQRTQWDDAGVHDDPTARLVAQDYVAQPRWGTPAPIRRPSQAERDDMAPLPAADHAPAPRRQTHPRARRHVFGWSLPIEHIVLAAGIVGMFLSLTQPWGTDATGKRIMLMPPASQAAYYVLIALAALGGLLVLLNRRMGCLAMIGCLGLLAVPILAAATIGGIEVFTQLHVIPHITPANVKVTNRGFFLWWGGLAVTLVGVLFEIITHRKRGLLGI
jgi:hypothetical protein